MDLNPVELVAHVCEVLAYFFFVLAVFVQISIWVFPPRRLTRRAKADPGSTPGTSEGSRPWIR
jgi:hypothetical protein